MAEERRLSITSSPLLAPDDVARHSFTTVRRGFDAKEVRAYLESLAHGLAGLAEREQQLLEELAAADRRAANPVLDEPTLVAALGQQTARVLQSAHEVADELRGTAREEAERLRSEAIDEATAAREAAEIRANERMAEVEAAAASLLEEAEARAASLLGSARRDSDELRERTKDECRAMLEEAQQLRARVLADLTRRRRLLHAQIEQLRAGRERLAETIDGVRRSVDGIADDLFTAEDHAREAAETAARALAEREEEDGGADGDADELGELLQASAEGVVAGRSAHPEVDDGGAGEDEAGPEGPAGGRVDELFARLRADHDEGPAGADPRPDPDAAVTSSAEADTDPGRGSVPSDAPTVETAVTAEPAEEGDGVEEADEDGPPADRPPAVLQRDELIAPVVTMLSRRLKRTLQDAQNELLDQLRSNRSQWSPSVLPEETEQLDGLTTSVVPVLEEAAEAGVAFAGGNGVSPATDEVIAVAHSLAEEVVGPLRRRLAADDGVAESGEAGAAEHVGAAFREWRGSRVERLAGDYVVAAFSLGSMAAVRKTSGDKRLEWVSVPGSGEAPCPDCEDNGLAGPQPPGDSFPTGHRHPPAHSGCRCLVAPAAP
jgi:DivIVA domain-containing protein